MPDGFFHEQLLSNDRPATDLHGRAAGSDRILSDLLQTYERLPRTISWVSDRIPGI
ncbi:MAG: hypothetical protein F6K50_02680 [Moorea sp. SIO3I7]|nr:hypothetical protein [Moorena sp. SIO3I7]